MQQGPYEHYAVPVTQCHRYEQLQAHLQCNTPPEEEEKDKKRKRKKEGVNAEQEHREKGRSKRTCSATRHLKKKRKTRRGRK